MEPSSLLECSAEQLAAVAARSMEHGVAGQLGASFERAGLPVPGELSACRVNAATGHLRKLRALGTVAAALDAAGLAWLAMKGPVLAGRWYADAASREYKDLDLLVAPGDFGAAIDVLRATGFRELNRNWTGARSVGLGEMPLGDGTVMVDLHWDVVALERDRRDLGFDTKEILERRVPVKLGSLEAWTMADDDTLGHVAMHAALNGGRLLLHLRDVQTIAAQVDWAQARRRMAELRLDRMVTPIFARVEKVFGPLGPANLTPTLDHRAWHAVNASVDAVWNVVPLSANPFPSALAIAGRPTAIGTVGEILGHVGAAFRTRLGLATVTSAGGPLDTTVDAGGATERRRYLDEVSAGCYAS
jgi:hypothetical protein